MRERIEDPQHDECRRRYEPHACELCQHRLDGDAEKTGRLEPEVIGQEHSAADGCAEQPALRARQPAAASAYPRNRGDKAKPNQRERKLNQLSDGVRGLLHGRRLAGQRDEINPRQRVG